MISVSNNKMVRSKTPPRKKNKNNNNNSCFYIIFMIGFFYLYLKLFFNEILKIEYSNKI